MILIKFSQPRSRSKISLVWETLPCKNEILTVTLSGVRVDTWVETGTEISPFYDSLIGKLMVHGKDRKDATAKMLQVSSLFHLEHSRVAFWRGGDLNNEDATAKNLPSGWLTWVLGR
jgi:acetyl/propionyl-CoA carboxylase alpha subunit